MAHFKVISTHRVHSNRAPIMMVEAENERAAVLATRLNDFPLVWKVEAREYKPRRNNKKERIGFI